jgi:hypothetical protein
VNAPFREWLARQVEACAQRAVNDNTKKSREYHGHTRILLQGVLAEYDRRQAPSSCQKHDDPPEAIGPPWWCETCTSWRQTMPCGRDDCPKPTVPPSRAAELSALARCVFLAWRDTPNLCQRCSYTELEHDLAALLAAQTQNVDQVKAETMNLRHELGIYLDTLVITGDNIGEIRRSLFMPWDSAWNGIVREVTAQRERPASSPSCVCDGEDGLRSL